jgi:hypothetical protein
VQHVVQRPREERPVGVGEAAHEGGGLAGGAHRVGVRQRRRERAAHGGRRGPEVGDGEGERDLGVQRQGGQGPAAGFPRRRDAEHRAAEAGGGGVVGVPLQRGAEGGHPADAEPEPEERVGQEGAGGERGGRRAEPARDRHVGVRREGDARRDGPAERGARGGEPADQQVVGRGAVAERGERAGAGDARGGVRVRA